MTPDVTCGFARAAARCACYLHQNSGCESCVGLGTQTRGLHGLKTEARTRPVPEIVWPDPSGTVKFRARTDPKSPLWEGANKYLNKHISIEIHCLLSPQVNAIWVREWGRLQWGTVVTWLISSIRNELQWWYSYCTCSIKPPTLPRWNQAQVTISFTKNYLW